MLSDRYGSAHVAFPSGIVLLLVVVIIVVIVVMRKDRGN